VSLDEYYRRLELPIAASPADIKRAYRRLRAKYHPDHNKGRESAVEPAFKRLQEAFEILTGKRKPPQPTFAAPAARENQAPPRTYPAAPPMRGANCMSELFVPLDIAIHGGEVEAIYPINRPCPQCQKAVAQCAKCNGSGRTVSGMRCIGCAGTGRAAAIGGCRTCRGTGIENYRKSETVSVPPGAWDGQRLVAKGGGHPGPNGGPAGDAIFSVAILCDAAFRRDGLNLAHEIRVDFVTATLGGDVETQVLGRAMQVKIPPNAQPGSTIRLPAHGLTDRSGKRGDLTLHLALTIPAAASHLTDDERQRLREMFDDAERRRLS